MTGSTEHGTDDPLVPLVPLDALQAAAQKLSDAGLQEQVDSWIGTGPNEPVTPEQITEALGARQIADTAEQLGAEPYKFATGLAALLPSMFDYFSPSGVIPDNLPIPPHIQPIPQGAPASTGAQYRPLPPLSDQGLALGSLLAGLRYNDDGGPLGAPRDGLDGIGPILQGFPDWSLLLNNASLEEAQAAATDADAQRPANGLQAG